MMTNSSSRFNMHITEALLAAKMLHSVKFKTPSWINSLKLSQYKSNFNNDYALKATDILRQYLSNLPFFLVKEISPELINGHSSNYSMNDDPFKTTASNELVIPRKTSTKSQNMINNLEVMMAHLMYMALQFYFFGGRKNIGNISALTYENVLTPVELDHISHHEVPDPEPVSCDCPLVFGYIIPVNFFGNPLGLQSYCRRKNAHISSSSKQIPGITEKCIDRKSGSYLKPIGFEVKSRTKNAPSETSMDELQSTDKLSNNIDTTNSNIIENILGVPNCHIQVPTEFEIAPDDGNHPLLDCFEPEKKGIKMHRGLENLLEHAFSGNNAAFSSNSKNEKKRTCNPPCSVWCDSLKAPDQDTVNVSNAQKQDFCSNDKTVKRNLELIKPFYPKNFSPNNPHYLKYDDIQHDKKDSSQKFQNVLPEHSIIREDPVDLQKKSELQVNNGKNILLTSLANHQDEDYISDQVDFAQMTYLCQRNKRSTWSFVEDKNSLWQPLPDCIPCDNVVKHPIQKRMHFRRQKSLS